MQGPSRDERIVVDILNRTLEGYPSELVSRRSTFPVTPRVEAGLDQISLTLTVIRMPME